MGISVVILSAGSGTRMKSQTPKVLHSLCGKCMLFYVIDEALALSDDVHIVLFYEAERIKSRILDSYPQGLHFHLQDHKHFPGTGGALMRGGEQNPKQPFSVKYDEILILNGDMPLVKASSLQKLSCIKAPIVMSILHLDNPKGYGRVVLNAKKEVLKIIEEKDAKKEELEIKSVNAGVYKMRKDVLESYLPRLNNHNAQSEFYLTDVIAYAREEHLLIASVLVDEKEFMGVNNKAHLSKAECALLENLRNEAMEEGVIMHLPESIYIEPSVRFEGECIIESGVQILGECLIKNSHIKAHSIIESSIIESSDIGPLAHIRPKSHIKNTHIGNFVETKSAHLDGVKAGHLSYLGDCEVGNGSNIGAGVITCNYDGKNKHQTIIGENVFVGSDTQFVAPVKIASKTLIGAGSTITKDTQEGELVLSRSPQKHIPQGYMKFFNIDSESH